MVGTIAIPFSNIFLFHHHFQMGSKREINQALFFSTMLLLLVGFVNSDLNQEKAECTDKLIALANCLPFVTGQSKAPPIDCCTSIKEIIVKSKRCLCILIKEHDNPELGLNINVTLALKLPTICSSPTNITECIDLLHLAPKSKEAKIFEGFEKTLEKNSTTPVPPSASRGATGGGSGGGNGTSTGAAKDTNGSGLGKRWLVAEMFCGILPLVFISHFFIV